MKRKFSFWLNIATICLCFAAIAIGVYAATSATLQINGQIGFAAHDCMVEVSMTKTGYASDDLTAYENNVVDVDMNANVAGNQKNAFVAGNSGENTISSVNLGTLNFTDLVGTKIPEIVLTLTVTNKSDFKVAATLLVNTIANTNILKEYNEGLTSVPTKSIANNAVILDKKTNQTTEIQESDESVTFTVTLKVDDENLPISNTSLQLTANFAKYSESETYIDSAQGLVYSLQTIEGKNEAYYNVGAKMKTIEIAPDPENPTYKEELQISDVSVSEVVIPNIVNGLPVLNIRENGFFAASSQIVDMIGADDISIVGLTSITLPDTLQTIGESAFCLCLDLTSIFIPNSVTTISDFAFAMTGLTSISGLEGLLSIGQGVFDDIAGDIYTMDENGCKYLSIENNDYFYLASVPRELKTHEFVVNSQTKIIGSRAFEACEGIDHIKLPDGVKTIGYYAFGGAGLHSVEIPASVKYIGESAFSCCLDMLSAVFLQEDPSKIIFGEYIFSSCGTSDENVMNGWEFGIKVPNGSVDAYKQIPQLSEYNIY